MLVDPVPDEMQTIRRGWDLAGSNKSVQFFQGVATGTMFLVITPPIHQPTHGEGVILLIAAFRPLLHCSNLLSELRIGMFLGFLSWKTTKKLMRFSGLRPGPEARG